MNIGVNVRLLLKNRIEGIGRFTFESLQELVKIRQEDHFFFFFDRAYDPEFIFAENITPVVFGPPAVHPVLWDIWFQFQLPRVLKKYEIDLFFSPESYVCHFTTTKQISVQHDVNFLRNRSLLKGWNGYYLRRNFPKFAHRSDLVLTVSEFSAKEIQEVYGLEKDKIQVCYNGVSKNFKQLAQISKREIQRKYTDSQPFFLFVGAISKRKNISKTVLAFDEFKTETGSSMKFLIVGKPMFSDRELETLFNSVSHKKDLLFLGRQTDEVLIELLNGAEALVNLSTYEGFGLPLVEAMACGCPVLAANNSCMPEIVKDAGLLVDPENKEAIKKAYSDILDSKRQEDLVEKGLARAQFFTWEKVALNISKAIDYVAK
ncbi:MAG: glycosyltransferase family 4 protein [Flavobacteriales bacterium]|jgi:glycosyltransferase involved in cell wall biosynthesis|nr:glycosyltransferase family 4 protein [Flavobacteriales bacterium]